jgi:hypothetical protein
MIGAAGFALGSLSTYASAVGAYVLPKTGSAVDLTLADRGTLAGAVCFFAGTLLAIPAWRRSAQGADAVKGPL